MRAVPISNGLDESYRPCNWRGDFAQPTESLWCLVHRFQALNQLTTRECATAFGLSMQGGQGPSLVYRSPDLPTSSRHMARVSAYDRVFACLELSEQTAERATVPLLPFGRGRNVLRYCAVCLARGFHSSVFQLRHMDRCPAHGAPLRYRCTRCRAGIVTRFNSALVYYPGRCPSCGLPLLNPLTGITEPLDITEQAAFLRAYDQYAAIHQKVVSVYLLHRAAYPSNTDLFRIATACPKVGTTVHVGPTLYRLFYVGKGGPSVPVGRAARPLVVRPIRIPKGTRRLADVLPPYWEHEPLVNVYRAWRRNLERGIPGAARGTVGRAKWTHLHPELEDQWYMRADAELVVVWFLLWRYVRAANLTQAGVRRHRNNGFGPKAPHGHHSPWYPKPLSEFLDHYHHGLCSGQPPVHSDWPTLQAFGVFLAALRDEAQAWARALRRHAFAYPYWNCPIQGSLRPHFLVTRRAPGGELIHCAWRPLQAEAEMDARCEQAIAKWKVDQEERRATIDKMRSFGRPERQ